MRLVLICLLPWPWAASAPAACLLRDPLPALFQVERCRNDVFNTRAREPSSLQPHGIDTAQSAGFVCGGHRFAIFFALWSAGNSSVGSSCALCRGSGETLWISHAQDHRGAVARRIGSSVEGACACCNLSRASCSTCSMPLSMLVAILLARIRLGCFASPRAYRPGGARRQLHTDGADNYPHFSLTADSGVSSQPRSCRPRTGACADVPSTNWPDASSPCRPDVRHWRWHRAENCLSV